MASVIPPSTIRAYHVSETRVGLAWVLDMLETAMQIKPGPYPDPECPIHRWQMAHEHLLAAQALLED